MALGNLCVKPKETPSVKISNGVFILWVLIRNCLISVIIASPFFFFLFFFFKFCFHSLFAGSVILRKRTVKIYG